MKGSLLDSRSGAGGQTWVTKARRPQAEADVLAALPTPDPGHPGPQARVLAAADAHEDEMADAVHSILAAWRRGWTLTRLRRLLAVAPATAADALDPNRPDFGLIAELEKNDAQVAKTRTTDLAAVLLRIMAATSEAPENYIISTFSPDVADLFDGGGGSVSHNVFVRRVAGLATSGGEEQAAIAVYRWQQGIYTLGEFWEAIEDIDIDLATEAFRTLEATASGSFTVVDPAAVAWANRYSAQLVQQIDDATRAAIRAIIAQGQAGDLTIDGMARLLRSTVGLHTRQAAAVNNLRGLLQDIAAGRVPIPPGLGQSASYATGNTLASPPGPYSLLDSRPPTLGGPAAIAQGMTEEAIEEVIERYAERALRYRSRMIARTETVRAANAGLLHGWEQGIEEGWIGPNHWVEWVVNPDDRLCSICRGMANDAAQNKGHSSAQLLGFADDEGEAIGSRKLGPGATDSQFRGPPKAISSREIQLGELYDQPPAHPGCRCTMVMHLSSTDPAVGPNTVITEPMKPIPKPDVVHVTDLGEPLSPLAPFDVEPDRHNPVLQTQLERQQMDLLGIRDFNEGHAQGPEAKNNIARNILRALKDDPDMTPEVWDDLAAAYGTNPLSDYPDEFADQIQRAIANDRMFTGGGEISYDEAVGQIDVDFTRTGDFTAPRWSHHNTDSPDWLWQRMLNERANPQSPVPLKVRLYDGTPWDGDTYPDVPFVIGSEGHDNWRYFLPPKSEVVQDRLRYATVSNLIHEWAVSSGDNHKMSLLIQHRIREVFDVGVDPIDAYGLSSLTRSDIAAWVGRHPKSTTGIDRFIQAMYAQTQADLRAKGLTHVRVGRGASVSAFPDTGPDAVFALNPASSFSTTFNTAYNWSDRSGWVVVPADRVLSTARTGFGCLNEGEVVVLGAPRIGNWDRGWVVHR